MEADRLYSVSEGTPQGGVISPLLANVALHGMERALQSAYTQREGKPFLVRYADDFVVLHPTQAGTEKARQLVETWLTTIGLELKPSKTRMTHTLNGEAGFSFLGFQVRQYPVGKTHTGHTADGAPIGHKTLIKPDPEAVKRHMAALRRLVRVHRNATRSIDQCAQPGHCRLGTLLPNGALYMTFLHAAIICSMRCSSAGHTVDIPESTNAGW